MPDCAGNFRQVVPVRRSGAEGIFSALRTRRMVDAPDPVAELEQLALEPLVSPAWFSVASRSISAAISALTGGRPIRCG